MVNSALQSQNNTASPQGTPQLTINHEATVDLDSTNAFEGELYIISYHECKLNLLGPEKLLEVWFAPSADALPITAVNNGLKAVSAETWKGMLDLVHCTVLSVAESDDMDAYLLSESSLFVFPHKLILKTCGTTTLLYGLPRLLEIAAISAGFPRDSSVGPDKIAAMTYRVFYSRKNFMFPGKQHGPHKSWSSEVKCLDSMFNGGSAYMVGKMNGDHWYLYLTAPNPTLTPPVTPEREATTETKLLNFPGTRASKLAMGALATDDETLEVLMTDLEPENAKQFYLDNASAVAQGQYFKRANEARQEAVSRIGDLTDVGGNIDLSLSTTTAGSLSVTDEVFSNPPSDVNTPEEDLVFPEELSAEGHALGTVVSEACGLSEIYPLSKYPNARVDAYVFTPCGFSANGIVPSPASKGTHYFTVHVAPEPQNSYASFETNVPGRQSGRETMEVIEQVVNIFKPGRFSVTLFEATVSSTATQEMKDLGLDGQAAEAKKAVEGGMGRGAKMDRIDGYTRVDRIVHDLNGYDLVFRYYERNDWAGGAPPRLGETDY